MSLWMAGKRGWLKFSNEGIKTKHKEALCVPFCVVKCYNFLYSVLFCLCLRNAHGLAWISLNPSVHACRHGDILLFSSKADMSFCTAKRRIRKN